MTNQFGVLDDGYISPKNPVPSDLLPTTRATMIPQYASTTALVSALGRAAAAGDVFYDTTLNTYRFYNGSTWLEMSTVNYPNEGQGLGTRTARDTTASYVLYIEPGYRLSDDGTTMMVNRYNLPVDKTFPVGSLSLDTGTMATYTHYAIWLLYKDSDTTSGTNTTYLNSHLIDTGGDFSSVNVGDPVYNLTDDLWAKVTVKNSSTDLTLNTNIFTSTGKAYIVGTKENAVISTSFSSPTLPTGYTKKLRVGSVITLSLANYQRFYTMGAGSVKDVYFEETGWSVFVALNSGTATSKTSISLTTWVPAHATKAFLRGRCYNPVSPGTTQFARDNILYQNQLISAPTTSWSGDFWWIQNLSDSRTLHYWGSTNQRTTLRVVGYSPA